MVPPIIRFRVMWRIKDRPPASLTEKSQPWGMLDTVVKRSFPIQHLKPGEKPFTFVQTLSKVGAMRRFTST